METAQIADVSLKYFPEKIPVRYRDIISALALSTKELEFINSYKYLNAEMKFLRSSLDLCNIVNPAGFIVSLQRVNDIHYVNNFFAAVNTNLLNNGIFISYVEIYSQRRNRIAEKYPKIFVKPFLLLSFIFNRVLPRITPTKWFHKYITKGNNRVLSKAEVFGRLVCTGFEILGYQHINNQLYFAVKKVKEPCFDSKPTYGLFVKMKRIGKGGKEMNVYKLRTMHPYSEYLQDYVFKNNHIDSGGKFINDFRVARWGKYIRMFWLDELPMIFNFIKGDLKLVGVRPLSAHYFNLYPFCFRERRIKYKPGLIPPYYADLPKTIDDIVASEKKYLDLYDKHPLTTDIKYFFLVFINIILRGARSR